MPHPLSVQLWTVRDALAADPAAAFARLAEIGFTTVEPFGLAARAAEYAELLPAAGLTASSAHTGIRGQDLDAVFAAAKLVGVPTVIEPSSDQALWTTLEGVTQVASDLNAASAVAAEHGISIGYHNHWWELENLIDGTPALEVFAGLLDPAVVLEVDTYWSTVGGVPAPELLRRLGDRVRFIHVKDGDLSSDNKRQVAVGSGRMPELEVLSAAPQAVRVVELDDFDGDVFDALRDSVAYLTANGESL